MGLEGAKSALLLCQAGLCTIRSQNDLVYLFSKVANLLTTVADHSLRQLQAEFMAIPTMKPEDLHLNNPAVQRILMSLEVLLTWVKIHNTVFERYESRKNFGFTSFVMNNEYT